MHSTIEIIIIQYDFNLRYVSKLVEDIPEKQMTIILSKGIENHPAFTLGHLVSGSAMLAEDLDGTMDMPEGWDEIFIRKGPGDPRMPDMVSSKYPAKKHLLSQLNIQHEYVKELLRSKDEEQLTQNIKWRFSDSMPTLLDLAAFMCITHESMHIGQLACWRRAFSYPSALAML